MTARTSDELDGAGARQRTSDRRTGRVRTFRRPLTSSNGRTPLQITRNSLDTSQGQDTSFTGTVYAVAVPEPHARVGAGSVHFTPGARAHWHSHPYGQTIFVTEGIGRCQHEGGAVEKIRPGDRVFFAPGENHWHGAAPNRFMTHIAIQEVDRSGSPVTCGDPSMTPPTSPPPPRSARGRRPHSPHTSLENDHKETSCRPPT
jgi:quercetin dioxygenase-like cupin family protein